MLVIRTKYMYQMQILKTSKNNVHNLQKIIKIHILIVLIFIFFLLLEGYHNQHIGDSVDNITLIFDVPAFMAAICQVLSCTFLPCVYSYVFKSHLLQIFMYATVKLKTMLLYFPYLLSNI